LIIRFGYVAMSAILEDCSPSQTITFKNLSKITSAEGKHSKLFTLAKRNLQNIQRLFFHNQAHDIKVFRLTSKLVPLATHPDTQEWNWAMELKQEFKKLGKYAREHGFRLSAHPDHFTLLNSPRDEILAASIKDLEYHRQIFAGMEMDASSKLVIHVGGCYKNKADSLKRFKRNYLELPGHLKERIVLENDDKIFTARDVLDICTDVGDSHGFGHPSPLVQQLCRQYRGLLAGHFCHLAKRNLPAQNSPFQPERYKAFSPSCRLH
jgi:UV DNA damage endonuclease